jgi:transcriptional regulator with XRE-family HTH domain
MTKIEPFYTEFGARMKEARNRMDITQDNMAEILGVSRATLANIESARQRVLAHDAVRIAAALKFKLPETDAIKLERSEVPVMKMRWRQK